MLLRRFFMGKEGNVFFRCLRQREFFRIMGAETKGRRQKMPGENIRTIRKEQGLSQEELAERIHVVRQTVSKWEKGLSVPDAELLEALSEALETPVSVLLGENVVLREERTEVLAKKLEEINFQLARRKERERKALHWFFLLACAGIAAGFLLLFFLKSPYLGWNFSDPEAAVMGTLFHGFEYLFVRAAPVLLAGAAVGAFLTRKRQIRE